MCIGACMDVSVHHLCIEAYGGQKIPLWPQIPWNSNPQMVGSLLNCWAISLAPIVVFFKTGSSVLSFLPRGLFCSSQGTAVAKSWVPLKAGEIALCKLLPSTNLWKANEDNPMCLIRLVKKFYCLIFVGMCMCRCLQRLHGCHEQNSGPLQELLPLSHLSIPLIRNLAWKCLSPVLQFISIVFRNWSIKAALHGF